MVIKEVDFVSERWKWATPESKGLHCCEVYVSQSGVIAFDTVSSPSEVSRRLTSLEKQGSLKEIVVKECEAENRKGG